MANKTLCIGLVAHDATKKVLSAWVGANRDVLMDHQLYATGTTCRVLKSENPALNITALKSGPLGGDQQLGALISEGKLDALFFFQDPMTAQPHDVDIKALVRLSTLYNIPLACNQATADLIVSNPGFSQMSEKSREDMQSQWASYLERDIPLVEE